MIFFLISLTTYYFYFYLKTNKAINVLENSKYSVKEYFKVVFKMPVKSFGLAELAFIVLAIIAFVTDFKITAICTVVFYMMLSLYLIKGKPKFKINTSNVRVLVITILLFAAVSIPIIIDCYKLDNTFIDYNPMFIYYTILYVVMYLLWFIVGLAGLINSLFVKEKRKKK